MDIIPLFLNGSNGQMCANLLLALRIMTADAHHYCISSERCLYNKKLWLNMDIKRQSGVDAQHLIYSIYSIIGRHIDCARACHARICGSNRDRLLLVSQALSRTQRANKYFELLLAFGYFMELRLRCRLRNTERGSFGQCYNYSILCYATQS